VTELEVSNKQLRADLARRDKEIAFLRATVEKLARVAE